MKTLKNGQIVFRKNFRKLQLPKYELNSVIRSLGSINAIFDLSSANSPFFQYKISDSYYSQFVVDQAYCLDVIRQNQTIEKLQTILHREFNKSSESRDVFLLKCIRDYLIENPNNYLQNSSILKRSHIQNFVGLRKSFIHTCKSLKIPSGFALFDDYSYSWHFY